MTNITFVYDDDEISEIKWIGSDELKVWMDKKPAEFTQGFIKTFNYCPNSQNSNHLR